jgi:hypothetical protein
MLDRMKVVVITTPGDPEVDRVGMSRGALE